MQANITKRQTIAFSLVELSIVIVIIGFLIAGITTGQSIIKSSQLMSVVSELNSIKTSVNTFKLTYRYLPGDYPAAGAYWSSNSSCPNSAAPAGCNGDGDGYIGDTFGSGQERLRSWQHLSLARLVNGNYTGTTTPSDRMPSKLSPGYYELFSHSASLYFGRKGTTILLGAIRTSINDSAGSLLIPGDAKSIDIKIDDGIANKGNLYAFDSNTVTTPGSCSATATSATGADYNLTTTTPACMIYYWLGI